MWQKVVPYLLSKKFSPAHPCKMLSWHIALFKEQFTKGAFSKVCRRAFWRECSLGLSKMLSHILWQTALLAKCSCPQDHFVWRAFCQRIWRSIFERAKEHSCKIDKKPDVFVLSKIAFLEFFFGFGSIKFVVICYYTFSNKIAFLLSFFDPFKCILA